MNFCVRRGELVPIDFENELGTYRLITDVLEKEGILPTDLKISLYYENKDRVHHFTSICEDDSNGTIAKMKETANFDKRVVAHWSVKSGNIYKFGEWGSVLSKGITYDSYYSRDITASVRSELRNDDELDADRFELLVLTADDKLTEITTSNVHLIARKCLFINYLQQPYPELNYTIMKHFVLPWEDANTNDCLTKLKQGDQGPFRHRLEGAVEAHRKQYGVNWADYVTDATNELIEWLQAIGAQRGFNAAVRAVIVQTMCKYVSLLTAHPLYLGLPQCIGDPPAHMLGSGPVDVKVGAAVVAWARDAVVVEDVDHDQAMDCDDAAENHKFPPPVDKNELFPQLSGACHDAAFVSAEMQQNIAEVAGAAADPGTIKPSRRSHKRPLEPDEAPVTRAHLSIGGFLMTGQAWEVINYTTSTFDAAEKPTITYLATLPLPVFTYIEEPRSDCDSGSSSVGAAMQTLKLSDSCSDNARQSGGVDRVQVERVLAALVLGAQGRLNTC